MSVKTFTVGDPVPWFVSRSTNNPEFHMDAAAGRYLILCFYGSMNIPKNAEAIRFITQDLRAMLDDDKFSFFGITVDPKDESEGRVGETMPGIRYFWDFDQSVSKLYGAIDADELVTSTFSYHSFTLVLDPSLRVIAYFPIQDPAIHNTQLKELLNKLPSVDLYAQTKVSAPILILPRVLEPEMCRFMIELYQKNGGYESGFMREKGGNTVGVVDSAFKRRKDFSFENTAEHTELRNALVQRIQRRMIGEMYKAFQFQVTRIERYIVACYEGERGGFFRAHRDNTTKGTAHRRFACTINLNAEEYDGGDLRFPEFGTQAYRAPTGGAVVFSCSLLHEALPVTKGLRYAFLPFFYDEAAAKIRAENLKFLSAAS